VDAISRATIAAIPARPQTDFVTTVSGIALPEDVTRRIADITTWPHPTHGVSQAAWKIRQYTPVPRQR
jgi:hypothetical protein